MSSEPSYSPGTLVQIISVSTFDSFPKDENGDPIIGTSSTGILNILPYTRRNLCGCLAKIERFVGYGSLSRLPFYKLSLYDSFPALDPTYAAGYNWPIYVFTPNEFHPVFLSTPISPVSFDDFMKGASS